MTKEFWSQSLAVPHKPRTQERCHAPSSQQVFHKMSMAFGLAIALCTTSMAFAQSDFTRILGPEDQDIPTPTFIGTIGQQDPAALQEITGYRTTVNATAWTGLQASGTFTANQGNTNAATLTILGSDKMRLDVTTQSGVQSTRINGAFGAVQRIGGQTVGLPPGTAKGGILAFPRLFASSFPDSGTTLVDRGQVQINGQSLHRITLEARTFPNQSVSAQINPDRDLNITDLYFDPATHRLIKSASLIRISTADRARYLVVLSYGDYQTVAGIQLPLNIIETMNGQRDWALQLNNPNLQPTVDGSYFHF